MGWSTSVAEELRARFPGAVLADVPKHYLADATEMGGLSGAATAVALPRSAEEAAELVAHCYAQGIAMVPRGGGTGFAGGAVPADGEVVISLEQMSRVRSIDPGLWRMEVDAGITTSRVHTVARDHGLFFPPDPGAAEQSQLGGNIACNAGGPHAFKYGVTRAWVTGIEMISAHGRLAHFGGPWRKDVAGYDMVSLVCGSEGTLGLVTGAWLRLMPAPEARIPVYAIYPDVTSAINGILAVMGTGLLPATLEFLDAASVAATRGAFPDQLPNDAGCLVLAEADGSATEAAAIATHVADALAPGSRMLARVDGVARQRALWRWRDGVTYGVAAQRGGKLSEDVVVSPERIPELLAALEPVALRHSLGVCSWGHAGDGNMHATFMLDAADPVQRRSAAAAAEELFAIVLSMGGSVSGEHGLGLLKRGQFQYQHGATEREMQLAVRRALDPAGLFNPGKKVV
ncbi:MAG: FAD-binding oxidoreductase [Candidatus Dormibacteria bacterium]